MREVLPVDRYTYLRLELAAGEQVWAAVPKGNVAIGARARVREAVVMQGFESTSLKRRFDQVSFGVLEGG